MKFEPFSPEVPAEKPPSQRQGFKILRQIIFQPSEAFAAIVAQERRATWLLPILLIVILTLTAAVVASVETITTSSTAGRTGAAATTQTTRTTTTNRSSGGNNSNQAPGGAFPGGGPGGDFPGGQIQVPGQTGGTTGRTTTSNGTTTQPANIWLSLLVPVAGVLLSWLLLGVLTNLFSLAWGGHSSALMAINIAAWSSLPLGVRNLMHIIYYLSTGTAVTMPGLSGFAPSANGNAALVFLQNLLSQVDLYLIWQIVLLAIGVGVWGGLARKKSLPIAILGVVLIIGLTSLIGMAFTMLGNINLNTNMLLRLR